MADDQNTPQAPQDAQEGSQQPQAQGQSQEDAQQPGPVPYDRFKEVNERARTLEKRLEQIEADRKAQQEKELAEQQKWQELAQQREAELKAERLRNTRQQIAMEKQLPAALVDRLVGENAQELAADADRLLELVKPATGPGNPPPPRSPQPANVDLGEMNPDEIRKLRRGQT